MIDGKLLAAIQQKLGIKRARAYKKISQLATELAVSNEIAALAVAQEAKIPINKYGLAEQITELREARQAHRHAVTTLVGPVPARATRAQAKRKSKPPSRNVFVVHGRNDAVRKSMFEFLRAIGLAPLEWSTAMRATRNAAPYIGQVLEKAFEKATAVVVLLTPDDEAHLRKEFWARNEEPFEKKLTGQARPNVLFEAGMAFGSHPRSTVLVEVGKCRPFSDTFGRHVVRLSNAEGKRKELADKLETAGCPVVLEGKAWLQAGNFGS